MRLSFSRNIYPKTALVKAAYMFTDQAYIHLDADSDSFIVEIESKDDNENDLLTKEFENELIAQTARFVIVKQTKTLREMMLARAVASTVLIDENYTETDDYEDRENVDVDDILTDWFEKNDQN